MNTIETLVDAHLAAYGEPDAAARREAIRAIWNANGRLVDPPMESAGHAGIADQAATLLAQFPGHRFHRTTAVDLHHGFARYGWALRNPQGDAVLEGEDFVVQDVDGFLLTVVGFFGAVRPRNP